MSDVKRAQVYRKYEARINNMRPERKIKRLEEEVSGSYNRLHHYHAQGRERLCEQVTDLVGAKLTALFTDIDTTVGGRISSSRWTRTLKPTFGSL